MAETNLTLVALSGVALLALCELIAWWFEARRSHPPGVSAGTRLGTLAAALAIAGGLTALLGWVVTLPVGDTALLAALGVASLVLIVRVVLSLASAVSQS